MSGWATKSAGLKPGLYKDKSSGINPLLHKEKGGGLRRRWGGAAVEGEGGVTLAEDAGPFEAAERGR